MARNIPLKDWSTMTRRWLGQVSAKYTTVATKEMQDMALDLRRRVRKRIRSGAAEGPALTAKTIRLKGHDTKLVEEHEYADGLNVYLHRTGEKGRKLFVGISLEGRPVEMALAHEFGSSKSKPPVPARPHWRPSIAELEASPRFREFLRGRWFAIAVPLD